MIGTRLGLAATAVLAGTLAAGPASAALTSFLGNAQLAAFNAAAGNPPISVDFDAIATGTDISGATLGGATFSSPSGNSLIVVDASTTTSFCCGPQFTLTATSGANVLSPGGAFLAGGPDLAQRDGLQIDFATPIAALGIDLLFQSLDGFSLAGATVYAADKTTVLFSNTFLSIPSTGSGGAYFLGFVSDNPLTNIGRIVFNDDDDNNVNPDSNLGYDTLRFSTPRAPVPEPASLGLLGAGLAAMAIWRRKRAAA